MILFTAHNLHVGGGVQVAAALISDLIILKTDESLRERFRWFDDLRVVASPEVLASVSPDLDPSVLMLDGVDLETWTGRALTPHVQFTIFGPLYRAPKARRHLVGFADVTSIYDWPESLPNNGRLKRRLRRTLSLRAFRSADRLVVETEAVRARLVLQGFAHERIDVVPNTYHPAFDGVQPLDWKAPKEDPKVLYVARAYPHKNHDFLGQVGESFQRLTGQRVQFTVTLTNQEWAVRSSAFKNYAENVGPMASHDLPELYRDSHAAIFPSLLECFSAMPLEALRMGVPLVAVDRDFVRTTCGDAAAYFDPDDADDAARALSLTLQDGTATAARIRGGQEVVSWLPSNRRRTIRYLEIVDTLT